MDPCKVITVFFYGINIKLVLRVVRKCCLTNFQIINFFVYLQVLFYFAFFYIWWVMGLILCRGHLGSSLISCKNDVGSSVLTRLLGSPTGFSPLWVLPWFFSCELVTNALSHLEQTNGFSPVWVLSCVLKAPIWLNALSQLEQANGFSPVWVLSCCFK